MGTIGFSRVLRINLSLKLSEVLYTVGLKPSMTGGCDGSKGASGVTGPGAAMFQPTSVGEIPDAKLRLLMKSLKRAGERTMLSVVRRRTRSLHSGSCSTQHASATRRTTFPKNLQNHARTRRKEPSPRGAGVRASSLSCWCCGQRDAQGQGEDPEAEIRLQC